MLEILLQAAGEYAEVQVVRAKEAIAAVAALRGQFDAMSTRLAQQRDEIHRERSHAAAAHEHAVGVLTTQILEVRAELAGLAAQLDAARAEAVREREHADQRVADLRLTLTQQERHSGEQPDEFAPGEPGRTWRPARRADGGGEGGSR